MQVVAVPDHGLLIFGTLPTCMPKYLHVPSNIQVGLLTETHVLCYLKECAMFKVYLPLL